jgi:hypothetical protein
VRHAGLLLALAGALAVAGCGDDSPETPPPPPTSAAEPPAPPSPAPEPATQATPAPTAAPELPPPSRAMSWTAAGAFVWHETDVDPELLGRDLLEAGFGWVAVFLHDGTAEDPVEADWVARFRRATGLPVGGWGVLRTQPADEAALVDRLLTRYGLDFYVADAETEYEYSGVGGTDPARFARSRAFVSAFRTLRPGLPAALSSYCRPDLHDLEWGAWRAAGFVFLPQAYVNDFGADAAPAACVHAAAPVFGVRNVHPTIGMHRGARRPLTSAGYARLLARAGTVGFSVYLAETRMDDREWQSLGAAIATLGIAR